MDRIKNTISYQKKEDIEISVGDEKQPDFYPRMKIKRWDNEVNFSVGVISDHKGVDYNVGDKVEWNDGHGVKARFYELPADEQNEHGIFEFEIVLDEKPVSNVVEMSIETKGLRFNYQPLNDENSFSGDNVVGSYAVYHASKKNDYSQCGGKNYRCGKAFHIYRPKIIDDKGDWVWGDLNVDVERGILSIEIDQKWLDNAVYPIVVDPTFGQTDTGGSYPGGSDTGDLIASNDMVALPVIIPSDATTVQSISMHGKAGYKFVYPDSIYYPFNAKGIIIEDDKTITSNGVSPSVYFSSSSASWKTATYGNDPDLTSEQNTLGFLGVICDANMGSTDVMINDYGISYDTSPIPYMSVIDKSNSYTTPTNPTDMVQEVKGVSSSLARREWSIYVTYTAASGGTGGGATQLVNGGLVS